MLHEAVGTIFSIDAAQALSPRQRLHLLLLGVDDVQRSRRFYEALGWKVSPTGHSGFEKIDLGGYALCLINKNDLLKDIYGDNAPASGVAASAMVYVAKSADQVARILAQAELAGGKIIKPAQRTPWGIAGYFTDPDGHVFEVDYEEVWVFDDEHRLVVDEINERTC